MEEKPTIPMRRRASGEPSSKRIAKSHIDPKEMASRAVSELTYVGTEFEYQSEIDKHSWTWDTLVNDLCPKGDLFTRISKDGTNGEKKYLYMFATSEVQFVVTKKHPEGIATPIPVVVVIVSDVSLGPCKLGIKGVQMEHETIIDGKKLRFEFAKTPLLPIKIGQNKGKNSGVPMVYVLSSSERISSGKNGSMDRKKTFEFANPYFFIPRLIKPALEERISDMCNFKIKYPGKGKKYYEGVYSIEDTFPEFSHIVADEEMKLKVMSPEDKEKYLLKIKEQKAVHGKKKTNKKNKKSNKNNEEECQSEKKPEEDEQQTTEKQEEIKDENGEVISKPNNDNANEQIKDEGEKEQEQEQEEEVDTSITPVTQEEYDKILADVERITKEAYKNYEESFKAYQEDLKKKLDEMSESTKNALDNLFVIKYYPGHPNFDMKKYTSNFAGRYIGEASKVIVCEKDPEENEEEEDSEESDL